MLEYETKKSHISYLDPLFCHKIAKSNILLLSDDFLKKGKNMTRVKHHNEQHERILYTHASNCDVHCIMYSI